MSQLNYQSKALQIIDIFQKFQFREISSSELEDILKNFKYKNTFLSFLKFIFQTPIFYPPNNTSHIKLSSMKVCTDSSSSDKRMKKILKLLSSFSKDYLRECLIELSSPLHFQEAKFYSDLFSGCKFGFSFDFANRLFKVHNLTLLNIPDRLVTWMLPKKVKDTFESVSFPVFGEPFYHGLLFKLISKNGKIRIYSEYNNDVTNCFPDFQRFKSILPDKTSFIDFILAPNSSLSSSSFNRDEFIRVNRCVLNNLPVDGKSSAIILIDFYWEDDKKDLSFRKERMKKLYKKSKKLNISPFILSNKVTTINDKIELKQYIIAHTNKQSTGCLIREANSKVVFKTPKWFKILPQFSPEVVKLVDYKFRYVPYFRLDFILGETEDNKQVVFDHYDQVFNLSNSISNLMGRNVRIFWRESEDKKEYKPIIFDILPELSNF